MPVTAAHIREVDFAIAKLKGLEICTKHAHPNWPGIVAEGGCLTFDPMNDWHDAGPLVEEMLDKGIDLNIDKIYDDYRIQTFSGEAQGKSKSVTHAICYAYLRANGIEHPERLGVE